jgi:hypothetical protein
MQSKKKVFDLNEITAGQKKNKAVNNYKRHKTAANPSAYEKNVVANNQNCQDGKSHPSVHQKNKMEKDKFFHSFATGINRRDFIRGLGVGVGAACFPWAPLGLTTAALVSCDHPVRDLSLYNVVWDTRSKDSFGSMPLGNGDIGMNVWIEENGDLLFYISKVDAFDAQHTLPKLGRVRLRILPALAERSFLQTLNLEDGSVVIQQGDASFSVWVDANHPLIVVEGKSKTPLTATITLETIRPLKDNKETLPREGTAGILFKNNSDELAWCYRNQSSVWQTNLEIQNSPEIASKVEDPLLFRTSGGLIRGKGFSRKDAVTLEMKEPSDRIDFSVKVLSSQPGSPEEWLQEVSRQEESDWQKHRDWWRSFWDRSYIHVSYGGEGIFHLDHARFTLFNQGAEAYGNVMEVDAKKNVNQISQRYALERFCQMAAGRGKVPPPFNGSIFTMDMPAGTHQFIDKGTRKNAVNADHRDWNGLPFFWQNTRHQGWSMLARGDYEAMLPSFKVVKGSVEIGRDRAMQWFGHEGSFMTEGIYWKGVSVFNDLPYHLKHHYLGTIEMTAMMCEYYQHTGDRTFLEEILLPCADAFIPFYEFHFPQRDESGKMIMAPAGVTETYSEVTNPVTEVSGLRYLLSHLLSFEQELTGNARREYWKNFMDILPQVPHRTVRGIDLLAPGEKYNGRLICETPELYAVWPFKQTGMSDDDFFGNARQSFHVRQISLDGTPDTQTWETGGWQSAPIWAAYLGLPKEAARLVSINFEDNLPNFTYRNEHMEPPVPGRTKARFPAFWETKMDYTPDNDHGGVSVNALQSMLIQEQGKKIKLLPAWPEDWDVSFRLHAASNTVVECEYRNGKVRRLKVEPEYRMADIDDRSTPHNRIRNLVEVALADRNYLFGLPPMLDAKPTGGMATLPWLQQYGHTLEGCKAGPWTNSVFKDNIVFVHILQWPEKGVHLPLIPRKLDSFESVTGDIRISETGQGWHLDGTPDPLNTIVKLTFDQSVEEIACGLPSVGSYTHGKELKVEKVGEGMLSATVDLGTVKIINRIEFTIDNPGYVWGNGKTFEFSIKDKTGVWRPYFSGMVYGTIFSKGIDPVATDAIQLVVGAISIKQLDVF